MLVACFVSERSRLIIPSLFWSDGTTEYCSDVDTWHGGARKASF